MNDIILSGLLSLFALSSLKEGAERGISRKVLTNYLLHHFGVRDLGASLEFYDALLSVYEGKTDEELNVAAKDIMSKLNSRLSPEDRVLMSLRLIEMRFISHKDDDNTKEFRNIIRDFDLDDSYFEDLSAFVTGKSVSENVKSLPYNNGIVRTLLLKEFDQLIFSYHGEGNVWYDDMLVFPGSFLIWQRSGVLRSRNCKPLYYYNVMVPYRECERGDKTKIKLRGNHIDFRFDKGEGGIHNFTFNLYGGELVAIMGGSGTGKSTLLSLLTGSLHPQAGMVSINGHNIDEPKAKALIGFVPQDNLLIEELTVYENLMFAAKFCFAGLNRDKLDAKVMALLHDLDLENVRDLKVGSAINKFISGGQRRRLNIALELIREPDILFLDEPTSGLSSADTATVVNLLSEQAYRGKLVIAIIHQPSSEVFKLFDRLWVFDKGGYPVYDGNPTEAITYFKKAANYADSDISTCPTCGNVNPEIILNIIDEKSLSDTGKITNIRKKTPQEWHELYLKTVPQAKNKLEKLPNTEQHRPSALNQLRIFLHRNLKAKLTDTQWLLITLLEAPVLAIICALLTRYTPVEGYSVMDNRNFVSYMFMAIIVVTFIGMSGSAEEIFKDRALLKREKFLNLSYRSYVWSKILFMGGVTLLQTFLFLIIGNGIMGVHFLFFEWWLILFVTAMLAALMGLILSQRLKSIVAIYITIPILLIPQILLCGLVVEFKDLNPSSTTGNIPIIGEIIPSRWAYEALAVTLFTGNDYENIFFEDEKQKYEARYYEAGYLNELKSRLETMHTNKEDADGGGDMTLFVNSMPLLMSKCGWQEYTGEYDYVSLKQLYKEAERALFEHSRRAAIAVDESMEQLIEKIGQDGVIQLKKDNYNLELESYLVNAKAEQLVKVVDNHIVPVAGYVFLTPVSTNGRAPFYSSEKIVGNIHIKTLWFNLGILLLMCVICIVFLMGDFPSRYFKKHAIFSNVKAKR
ncbi:MAG: ATP-binding cassette domain-containing protein [Bacteroidaceae bacterium]|nr:ATP-binding cassette domain-containing protein [Bacteroidaceae bacterium]